MSHLIEEYAKNLGVKIAKPMVAKQFWPIVFDKYITICLDVNVPAKQYKYYDTVLDMIGKFVRPLGLSIIQIGSSKSPVLNGVDARYYDMDFKNTAYIISKAQLHIGVDDVFSHYASSIDLPQVTLFSNVYPSISCGYWSKRQTKIESPWKLKPCFNLVDSNDYINQIKPEIIASAILTQLKIKQDILIKTKFIGNHFHNRVLELVPDFFEPINDLKNVHVFIRPDYGVDEKSFFNWLDFLPSYSIFADQVISLDILKRFSGKLKNVYLITDRNLQIPDEYLKLSQSFNVPVTLLVKNAEDLSFIRNKYFDYEVQPYQKANKKMLDKNVGDISKLLFNSSKTIISKGKQYPSKYHFQKGQNIVDKNFYLEDNEDLLQELNHFYVYTRNTN